MQRYIGTKIIEAEPFDKTVPHIKLDENENVIKVFTEVSGYKVKYEDGYESWSPKIAFENAYRRTDKMTFGIAIEALKKGYKVARDGWNGKGMFLTLVVTPPTEAMNITGHIYGFLPYIQMKTADDKLVPWLASQTDILAEDWAIVGLGDGAPAE